MRIWSWQHVSVIHCWVEPSLLLSSLDAFSEFPLTFRENRGGSGGGGLNPPLRLCTIKIICMMHMFNEALVLPNVNFEMYSWNSFHSYMFHEITLKETVICGKILFNIHGQHLARQFDTLWNQWMTRCLALVMFAVLLSLPPSKGADLLLITDYSVYDTVSGWVQKFVRRRHQKSDASQDKLERKFEN